MFCPFFNVFLVRVFDYAIIIIVKPSLFIHFDDVDFIFRLVFLTLIVFIENDLQHLWQVISKLLNLVCGFNCLSLLHLIHKHLDVDLLLNLLKCIFSIRILLTERLDFLVIINALFYYSCQALSLGLKVAVKGVVVFSCFFFVSMAFGMISYHRFTFGMFSYLWLIKSVGSILHLFCHHSLHCNRSYLRSISPKVLVCGFRVHWAQFSQV